MKKTLLILAAAAALTTGSLPVLAQQTNLVPIILTGTTTNITASSAYISIIGAGITNQPYTASNPMYLTIGDPLPVAFAKVNSNEQFLASEIAAQTNTVSVLNFSNSVLSSSQFVIFQTNNVNWELTQSNFVGVFSNIDGIIFLAGEGIGSTSTVPQFVFTNLSVQYSFTGTNGWTAMTDPRSFFSTNLTWISTWSSTGTNTLVSGSMVIYAVDHPELLGRTNSFFGQDFQVADPVGPFDPVNLETFNLLLGNALNGQFASSVSNNIYYATLSESGQPIITIAIPNFTLPSSLSKSGTNLLLNIAQTNLVTGWKITSSTNLAAIYSWATFTNWASIATNSGIVTFTIPILPTVNQYFYWPQEPALNSITITPPLTLLGGVFQPFYTPTNSADVTLGNLAGMMRWDTNYVYVGVSSNQWKRAALSAF